MAAKLQIQPAIAPPFEVEIGNTATIGRTHDNAVCLHFSPRVSRQHAVIRCHNGWQFQLIDLGSRNGTYVHEKRVIIPVTLENGAVIRIADNTIIFREESGERVPGQEGQAMTVAGTMSTSLEERAVALLVCDVRGFSTMSERVPSGDLAQFIGAWFRETGNLVHERAGTIDKFIGDAMLAYWDTGEGGPKDCGAALEVARRLLALAAQREWPGGEPFRVAISLHHGRVTFSNVGLAAARDATIIGDAVNTVFRLEAASKEIGRPVVLSHDFTRHLPQDVALEDFGTRELKGKRQRVQIFGLAG